MKTLLKGMDLCMSLEIMRVQDLRAFFGVFSLPEITEGGWSMALKETFSKKPNPGNSFTMSFAELMITISVAGEYCWRD